MTTVPGRRTALAFVLSGTSFVGVLFAQAQAPSQSSGAAPNSTGRPPSKAEIDAEREEIWNSADMLRARAWLQDYCSKSAKVTPDKAKQYQAELANLSPTQMKLWLLKFDEEEEARQQQYAMFQQANAAGLQQAAAVHRQTQQAYAAMNQAQSESAQMAQQKFTEQREAAQSAQENKQLYQAPPPTLPYGFYGGYGPIGYGGYGGWGGGVQYHYHLH